ncbi:MAG: class I SAM-dependent methyltransferase [Dysgonamonadaceae bacterium]|jgi:SAM-dependent methyltransferase|nr:class I SAM-dependent methyltransferase [Dysgonamonadaceae bacterium]
MFDFHADTERYFQMQYQNCKNYVIPFIENHFPLKPKVRVLEIGCGEAGVLKAFLDRDCECAGVEICVPRLESARERLSNYLEQGVLNLIAKDIYAVQSAEELGGAFDLIIMKDVIEHIPNQSGLLRHLKKLLHPSGLIFAGFPPWQMPFGGHQQVAHNRFISRFPYLHLLPMCLYKKVMRNESGEFIDIKRTGISIERFERIAKENHYVIAGKQHFFINPIYEYKFNLKMKKQGKIISSIPYLRNFLTTTVFYLIKNQ